MEVQRIGAITTTTLHHLQSLTDTLQIYLADSPNERALLLGQAFAVQLADVQHIVARVIERLPARALQRSVRTDAMPALPAPLSSTDDSRALTTWLVQHLQTEHLRYQHLLQHARTGPAKNAVNELAALFLAQSKRIALEAHRFSDL